VEHRRSHSYQRRSKQERSEAPCNGEKHQSHEREPHTHGQRVWLVPPVGIEPYGWLKYRGGHLIGQSDKPNLREAEVKRVFQDGVDRWNQRLHHVVQEMAEADGRENGKQGCSFCIVLPRLAESRVGSHPFKIVGGAFWSGSDSIT